MAPVGNTPARAVRVDDETWRAAMDRAQLEDRDLSSVIRVALRDYAAGRYDATPPKVRPPKTPREKK